MLERPSAAVAAYSKAVALDPGAHVTFTTFAGVMPSAEELAAKSHRSHEAAEPAEMGLTVVLITKELAQQYGIEVRAGVLVTAVEQDSPADVHGLRPGDVITAINRQKVYSPGQFLAYVKSADPKLGLKVNYVSEGESRSVVLKDTGGK